MLLLPVLCALAFAPIAADEQRPGGAAATITIDELRDHMFYLASDALQGRASGTKGYDIAAWYCASQFQAAGLVPAFTDEQGQPSWFQKVPLRSTYKTEKNKLVLTIAGVATEYRLPDGYGLMYFGKSLGELPPAGVVFVGYGIHEPSAGWDDYADLDVKGKYVILLMGAPKKADGTPALTEALDKKYGNMRMSIMPKFMTLKTMGAVGAIILPTPETQRSWKGMLGFVTKPQVSVWKEDGQAFNPLAFLDIPLILGQDVLAEALIAGRPYNPMTGAGTYGTFALDGVTVGLTVDVASEKVDTWNVGGIVPGTDEKLKKEYITIGAHLDHEGMAGTTVYNGADDNGSGSVAVIEAAEATAQTPARRSTLFLLYAAEEIGLIGSKFFVDNSPIPTADMVVNINMDMVGRQDDLFPQGIYALGSEKRSAELKQILIATNDATVKIPLDFRFDEKDPESWWTRSDQIGFHNKGIPVIFFTSGDHPDYHQPTDDADKIDYAKLQGVSQLCYEMAMALGNRDARPAMKSK